ncbi:signal peptide peptidase-like 2A isoform X2 [Latimeria chalumnae]|uniref:signal peptide peptidase-like 2A isoform X2 n=1 Tax=Latimeria chalumnae TaxID=7897 RepID=UPI0003C1697B|nr:PREDICTED: signal peptide peptidase-like 2A isoform X2 [Latimeria chalumnae]|eukprot:XP_006013268.1 PREDICTED: signal peptide peptidase-like 2A isoform X2 [Latimeria chalumnae]
MGTRSYLTFCGLIITALFMLQVTAQEGILQASGNEGSKLVKNYCILYNPEWTVLPNTPNNNTYYQLENLTSTDLCSNTDVPSSSSLKGKAVVVMRGNCTFLEKAAIAQINGAKALLIASKTGLVIPLDNKTGYETINIPIATIRYSDILDMKQTLQGNISVMLYSTPVPIFDYSMVIIFLIAVFTVALGGHWSGVSAFVSETDSGDREMNKEMNRKKTEESMTLTPLTVVIFAVFCCVMLLLLYFFYQWLVYVVIAVFCLASAAGLYNCLSALVTKIPFGKCRISYNNKHIEVRLVFLAAFCIALAVTWGVFRNEDRWAWILQDILGIAFCLNLIRTLRLPNFKACVILLSLLLLYDVFFVFITPFFTKNGKSIMVEVAAGPSSDSERTDGHMVEVLAEPSAPQEKLPVVIKVPRLIPSVQTLCGMPFSLLGFGDIILPGLLVAYCRKFDVWMNSSAIYYMSCAIAYAVGMVLTFVVLAVTGMGQPALLYLVPFTVVTSAVVAWSRKEIKMFWKGSSYEVLESTREPLLQDHGTSTNYS